jgi:hypothetical protein
MLLIFMVKSVQQWFLFASKPFTSKELAEKEREKYPERERRKIGLGLIRVGRE